MTHNRRRRDFSDFNDFNDLINSLINLNCLLPAVLKEPLEPLHGEANGLFSPL
jgi:hypothetical protein